MGNSKGKAQPFGSRSGSTAVVARGNTVKVNASRERTLGELEDLLAEATAMPAAATIVTAYQRDYGKMITDPAALNESLRSLCQVVKGHQDAVAQHRGKLGELRQTIGRANQGNQNMARIQMLDWVGGVQDIMNDFANIGMYAIDQALEPFRELARTNEEIPMPGYMTPRRKEDPAMVEQYADPNTKPSNRLILDVPVETKAVEVEVSGEAKPDQQESPE